MNCYDFDGTIYRKDCSKRFYAYCFFKKPFIMMFHIWKVMFFLVLNIVGFINTKKFKEKFFSFLRYFKNIDEIINSFWNKEKKYINNWYYELKKDNDVICSASPDFLVGFIMKSINPKSTVLCTDMDKNTGIINGDNLKGESKVQALKDKLKKDDLKFENVYTDSFSDFPLLDMAKNKKIVCGNKYYDFGSQKPTLKSKLLYSIKLLRIKHYVKNILIFLPLFFSGLLSDFQSIFNSIIGFIAFCFMASFVYIVNDIADVNNDRKHTKKRKRPIACYMIKRYEAIIYAILLFALSVGITYFTFGFNILIYIILIGYAVINLLYSFILKNIPIVDSFMLALCYLLRIFWGGVIIGTTVSKWLYLTVLCGALFMGFGKRRNEIKHQKDSTRKVNKYYNYNFLDKNLYICLAMSLVFYSLWAIDFKGYGEGSFNRIILLATIPFVYFIMMRYSLDIEQNDNNGDPIDVLLKDFVLIFACVVFVALIVISVYVPIQFNLEVLL